jgi:type IV pilus assembly protein PilB
MPKTEELERLTVEHAPASMIAEVARREGMTTLRDDGMLKVSEGVTSLDEIMRVVV